MRPLSVLGGVRTVPGLLWGDEEVRVKGTRMRKGVPSASGMFACVSKWDADKLRCGGCSYGSSKAGVDAWSSLRGPWLRVVL